MPVEPQNTTAAQSADPGPAPSSAPAELRPARGDVATLVRQLAQQKEATTRALESTMSIEKQLAQTREDLNRALMIAAIPPDPPPKNEKEQEEEAETGARKKSEDLESERKARVDERVTAAAQIARLEETVVHAREKEKHAVSSLKRARLVGFCITGGLLLAAIPISRVASRYPATAIAQLLAGLSAAPENAAEAPQSTPTPTPAEQRSAPARSAENLSPQASLEEAVARMHRALAAFPDAKPEELIEALRTGRVKVDPSSCLVAWNDGQPELLLQDRGGDGVKIAETLTQCASGIESAHNGMILKAQAHR